MAAAIGDWVTAREGIVTLIQSPVGTQRKERNKRLNFRLKADHDVDYRPEIEEMNRRHLERTFDPLDVQIRPNVGTVRSG